MKLFIPIILMSLIFSGCSMLPEVRIGQAKVPDIPTERKEKVEAERQASEYLTTVEIESPEAEKVAESLSMSLGIPDKTEANPVVIIESLREGIKEERKDTLSFRKRVEKYSGMKIEGTGWNISPVLGWTVIIVLIGGCVAFPPLFTFLSFMFKRARDTGKAMVKAVSQFEQTEPEAAAKLKGVMSNTMDKAHKNIISKWK